MIIKFTKDHPAGIKEGTVQNVSDKFAEKMISQEYAKKSSQTELDKFRKSLEEAKNKRVSDIQAQQAEAIKAKAEKEASTIKTKEEDCGCGDTPKAEGEEECEECKKKAAAKKTIGAGTRTKKTTTRKTTTKKAK